MNRLNRFAALAAFALLSLTIAAKATPVTPVTYTFSGDNQELTGTLIVAPGSSSNPFVGGSFSIFDGSNTNTFNPATDFVESGYQGPPNGNYGYDVFVNPNGDQFSLLTSLTPGPSNSVVVCSTANPCSDFQPEPTAAYSFLYANGNDPYQINNGFLVTGVSAATPEPSSFAFLGTGLLGAAAMFRRRFLRA